MVSASIESQAWRKRLGLPIYRVGLAAKYAGTTQQSVTYWHHGAPGRPSPVLRRTSSDSLLSYFELIEVAFVASMRQLGISLKKIRRTREYAKEELASDHPFSEYDWKTNGIHLLLGLHEVDSQLDVSDLIVGDEYGQLGWHDLLNERFAEFDYESGLVVTWHPRGRGNCVTIDPRVAFGSPTAGGIATWVIKERFEAGQQLVDIMDDFQLGEDHVKDALDFEGLQLSI